jgi:hypothetical protein
MITIPQSLQIEHKAIHDEPRLQMGWASKMLILLLMSECFKRVDSRGTTSGHQPSESRHPDERCYRGHKRPRISGGQPEEKSAQ